MWLLHTFGKDQSVTDHQPCAQCQKWLQSALLPARLFPVGLARSRPAWRLLNRRVLVADVRRRVLSLEWPSEPAQEVAAALASLGLGVQ